MILNESFVDVLLLTALQEERLLLDSWLKEERDAEQEHMILHDGFSPTVTSTTIQDLHVAVSNLSGMGNLWAVADTSALIRKLRPKCVLLVGLAAGKREMCELGDVGYSRLLAYSTCGKISEETFASRFRTVRQDLARDLQATRQENKKTKKHTKKIERLGGALKLAKEFGDIIGPRRAGQRMLLTNLGYPEIRLRSTEIIMPWLVFVDCASNVAGNEDWKEQAKNAFESWRSRFLVCCKDLCGDTYPDQEGFSDEEGSPFARPVEVASGEFVVANRRFQQAVEQNFRDWARARNKKPTVVGMYEMEGYGVASACRLDKVAFGLVKGFCDRGDTSKSDTHRLAAIASASAFVWHMINHPTFIASIRNDLRHSSVCSSFACLWTNPERPAPCTRHPSIAARDIACNKADCTSVDEDRFGNFQARACRLFENVDAKAYSDFILDEVQESDNGITFIFPYCPEDLLRFFEKQGRRWARKVRAIRTAVSKCEQTTDLREAKGAAQARQEILSFGREVRIAFGHFAGADTICRDRVLTQLSNEGGESGQDPLGAFYETAGQACRIVVLDNYESDGDLWSGKNRLLNLLYPAILGIFTPSFLVGDSIELLGETRRFVTDDLTYVRRGSTTVANELSEDRSLCIRYLNGTRTLIVTGKCDDVKDKLGSHVFTMLDPIRTLIVEARRGGDDGIDKLHRWLRRFPFKGMVSYAGGNWEEMLKYEMNGAQPDLSSISGALETYFEPQNAYAKEFDYFEKLLEQ